MAEYRSIPKGQPAPAAKPAAPASTPAAPKRQHFKRYTLTKKLRFS